MATMRIALFADIHSNLEALQACLTHARREGAERFAFLGDMFGYGADPLACMDLIAGFVEQGAPAVLGNHDAACLGGSLRDMSDPARAAILWTRKRLGPRERDFLASLPLAVAEEDRLYVHASADQPEAWTYITGQRDAARAFAATPARIVLVGHVHHPLLYFTTPGGAMRVFQPVPGVPIPSAVIAAGWSSSAQSASRATAIRPPAMSFTIPKSARSRCTACLMMPRRRRTRSSPRDCRSDWHGD